MKKQFILSISLLFLSSGLHASEEFALTNGQGYTNSSTELKSGEQLATSQSSKKTDKGEDGATTPTNSFEDEDCATTPTNSFEDEDGATTPTNSFKDKDSATTRNAISKYYDSFIRPIPSRGAINEDGFIPFLYNQDLEATKKGNLTIIIPKTLPVEQGNTQ